ncbi:MAG: Maf family protein, partial [Clostridia bacterium]|nr:Maf family protein [Clostridia bacterium]
YSLVERVDGEYETVVGLPISKVNGILEKIL